MMDQLDGFEERWRKRVPTCVAAFDSIVKGGIPAGSLVLLLGEIGAGQTEFAFTSAAKLALAKSKPHLRDRILGGYFKERGKTRVTVSLLETTRQDAEAARPRVEAIVGRHFPEADTIIVNAVPPD